MKKLAISVVLLASWSGSAISADNAYINMISSLIDDDYKTFMDGGDSWIGEGVTAPMSAEQLISMYEKNELAANKKLKGHLVRIKSVASEIGEDATGKAYIKSNGKNQFKSIMMYVDGGDDRILSLEKGSKIDFSCSMDKYIMHTPLLKKCVLTTDLAKQRKEKALTSTSADDVTSSFQAFFMALYDLNKLDLSQPCATSGKKCLSAIMNITKSEEKMGAAKSHSQGLMKGKDLQKFPI